MGQKPREHAHRRGLARAVGDEKSDDRHLKRDLIQGSSAGIPFGKFFDGDHKAVVVHSENAELLGRAAPTGYFQTLRRCAQNLM
jgi:hypothetical protein